MGNWVKKNWPLVGAIGFFWMAVAVSLFLSLRLTAGHLIYVLDDPYIHMAMAKNFSQHGVWGITPYEFSSSSSSLLWTGLLAAIYNLFGINELASFILNLIFGTLVVASAYFILKKYQLPAILSSLLLFLIVFSTSLISLVFCGQEHTLHILIAVLFIYLSAKILSEENPGLWEKTSLLALASFLTTVRYEGLFLLAPVASLFLLKRRVAFGFILTGLGLLPLVLYGWYSVSQGWYFFPNSVLLKAEIPSLDSLTGWAKFFGRFAQVLRDNTTALYLFAGGLAAFLASYRKRQELWDRTVLMALILTTTVVLHTQFARYGWYFRYEAYLVALTLLVTSVALRDFWPAKWEIKLNKQALPQYVATGALISLVIGPFLLRGGICAWQIPRASANIYQQQYQMGRFLKEFYTGKNAAANDVGAINYLADIKCLDLWGVGSREIAQGKRRGRYDTRQIYEMAQAEQTDIAIVYEHWFLKDSIGGLPPEWMKAGQWKISNNVVCGGDSVTFYAVQATEKERLIDNLKKFAAELPKDVKQSGAYTK